MRIGIIGAMQEEVAVLKTNMKDKKEWTEANASFTSGMIEQTEVILVQSGIGKVNSAIAATLLFAKHEVDAIVNTGSAGGIGKGLAVGDVVISTELAYHDVDATVFDYVIGQVPQMPARYPADQTLVKQTVEAAEKVGLKAKQGLILTSDSFVADKKIVDQIKLHFPEALASEMEGAAIAQVCYQFNKPFVIVRAMSDVADEEAGISFDEFIIEAGKKSGEMVIELIKNIA